MYSRVCLQVQNREQTQLEILRLYPATGEVKIVIIIIVVIVVVVVVVVLVAAVAAAVVVVT